jgi:hypothetical protein
VQLLVGVLEVAHLFVGTQLTAVLGPQLFSGTLTGGPTCSVVLRGVLSSNYTLRADAVQSDGQR